MCRVQFLLLYGPISATGLLSSFRLDCVFFADWCCVPVGPSSKRLPLPSLHTARSPRCTALLIKIISHHRQCDYYGIGWHFDKQVHLHSSCIICSQHVIVFLSVAPFLNSFFLLTYMRATDQVVMLAVRVSVNPPCCHLLVCGPSQRVKQFWIMAIVILFF